MEIKSFWEMSLKFHFAFAMTVVERDASHLIIKASQMDLECYAHQMTVHIDSIKIGFEINNCRGFNIGQTT